MTISNGVKIGGLQKSTLLDYPGRIAATVFLIGCNFRCPFCYSKELVLPEKIKKQPRISEKYFFDFLKERKGLLEGIVICGGEPTIYQELPEFVKKIKNLGYLVKLDTNGSNPEMLKKLIDEKLIDYVAMDIKQSQSSPKHPGGPGATGQAKLPEGFRLGGSYGAGKTQKYDVATGVKVDLNKIKKSIDILKEGKVDYEFRTTVVKTIHTKEDIIEIAKWLTPAKKYYLQNFRAEKTIDPKFKKIKPYSKDFLISIQKEISSYFEICEVRE